MHKNRGFSLIELAIAITIIGIILAGVLVGSEVITGNARATDTVALVKDLNSSIIEFKNRYRYLPGDLPNAANDNFGIVAASACDISPPGTIGNGQIDVGTETTCAAVQLIQAGLIKGNSQGVGIFTKSNFSNVPDVLITARRVAGLLPPTFNTLNEIQLLNQPCNTAQALDNKLDDGNFATGNIRASVATCVSAGKSNAGINDPVPILDIAL
jgi:prepilin-type N-terminal cleavage/methylation domain-containing protein